MKKLNLDISDLEMPKKWEGCTMTDEEFKVMWEQVKLDSANPTTCRTCGKTYTYMFQIDNHGVRTGHDLMGLQ